MNKIKVRTISQMELTSQCWVVQFQGLATCKTCESRDTDECSGQVIKITGKNAYGHEVPLGKEVESK